MLFQAKQDLDLDLSTSYIVGDAGWDMLLAKTTGCKSVLVLTGLGLSSLKEYKHTWPDDEPDLLAENVWEAVKKIAEVNS